MTGLKPQIVLPLLVLLVVAFPGRAEANAPSKVYAVVVANNHSLDDGFHPLRFADDDGAKYFELFTAAGAEVELLAVLDPDTANRFEEAASSARPPKKKEVIHTIHRVFGAIEEDNENGTRTEFVFVYSGHGNVGPNREGYINLLDEKLTRSELFAEVIAKSPATFNHIILDACHSYYLVEKKGGAPDKTGDFRGAVYDFLKSEKLASYPNTGVILASSKESESHEWSRWEAGIFSHELRSALLGTADVNQDGIVTYAEAAACIEAANATIEVERARLRVHYRAPAVNADAPLLDLRRFSDRARVRVGAEMAGRYQIEDERGVRVADFHFSNEQGMEVVLVGEPPFFIRNDESEAEIADANAVVEASSLAFETRTASERGSVERSFRHHLYETPFGQGFFRGVTASNDPGGTTLPPPVVSSTSVAPKTSAPKKWGLASIGLGTALGISSGFMYYGAYLANEEYEAAGPTNWQALKQESQNKTIASRFLLGAGMVAAGTGLTLIIVDRFKEKKESSAAPFFIPSEDSFLMGVTGTW